MLLEVRAADRASGREHAPAGRALDPFVALIMAAVGAQDRHRNGQIGQRNLFIALAVVNLALAFIPALRFGLYSLLLRATS